MQEPMTGEGSTDSNSDSASDEPAIPAYFSMPDMGKDPSDIVEPGLPRPGEDNASGSDDQLGGNTSDTADTISPANAIDDGSKPVLPPGMDPEELPKGQGTPAGKI